MSDAQTHTPPDPEGQTPSTPERTAPGPHLATRGEAPRGGRRRRLLLVLGVVVALFAVDLARPPAQQLSARFLLAGIDLYQATLSRRMPEMGVTCRFTPTCSRYAEGAIRKYGALVGTAKAAWRIGRCGPWTPAGTVDPP